MKRSHNEGFEKRSTPGYLPIYGSPPDAVLVHDGDTPSVYYGHGGPMIGLLESKQQAIAGLCERFGVARLEVFGSALGEDFRSGQSDLDLLVEFKPMESYARVDAYFGLLDELRRLLNQEIDLVMTGAVKNRYLSREIERTKQLLYAA